MQSILLQLKSFRLGYTEERPYPWKWTTPIVLIPLSAYNIVQESTYRPNDTLPALALSSLVPSVFQPSANSFIPQPLTVGDIIKLNGSLFEYTVVDAFDGLDETKPVPSFSYYNNPLSDGCDVVRMASSELRSFQFLISSDKCHRQRWPNQSGRRPRLAPPI
ncbi:hypothetical protein DFH08DRAFT_350882 [Mycena albidolilacea]|uniref:Uncharacterized protein n=1 Tax=Mycena albidolilacea TaxID=1033008 RepID=A0AAD6ZHN1_9AGAR|nr:hypothetical protein DFH08DRAFT_350882 [Mycena albidolilacea]